MRTRQKIIKYLILLRLLRRRRRKRESRSTWVRPWIGRRQEFGAYWTLVRELKQEDQEKYRQYFRVTPEGFNIILEKVGRPLVLARRSHFDVM